MPELNFKVGNGQLIGKDPSSSRSYSLSKRKAELSDSAA